MIYIDLELDLNSSNKFEVQIDGWKKYVNRKCCKLHSLNLSLMKKKLTEKHFYLDMFSLLFHYGYLSFDLSNYHISQNNMLKKTNQQISNNNDIYTAIIFKRNDIFTINL